MEVRTESTGRDLKRRVSQHWGLPCVYQALLIGDKVLADDETLEDVRVDIESPLAITVHGHAEQGALGPEESLRIAGLHPTTELAKGGGRLAVFRVREVGGARRTCTAKAVDCSRVEKEGQDSIKQEIALLRDLAPHPNLADCSRSFWDASFCFLVTPSELEGESMREVICEAQAARQPPSDSQMGSWAAQLLAGLAHLHASGGVHRCLNPSNISVSDWRRRVVIGDFGISELLTDAMSTRAAAYMSPELLRNEPYAPRADMWALGCVLFELHVLAPAFEAPSLLDLAIRIVEGVPDWSAWDGAAALQAMTRRLLDVSSDLRPSADELLAEVSCVGLPLPALPPKHAWVEIIDVGSPASLEYSTEGLLSPFSAEATPLAASLVAAEANADGVQVAGRV